MSALLLERDRPAWAAGDDVAVLAGIEWRRSVPRGLRRTAAEGNLAEFGRRMRDRPPFRQAAKRTARLMERDGVCHPYFQMLWSRRAFAANDGSARLAELLEEFARDERPHSRKRRARRNRAIEDCLPSIDAAPPDPFEQLGWLSLLLYETSLSDELFGRLWVRAYGGSQNRVTAQRSPDAAAPSEDQRLLMHGELPCLCAAMLADVRGVRHGAAAGAEFLRTELMQLTDDAGVPHARLLERLPLWLAPFTRSAFFGRVADSAWWDKPARRRFRKLVAQSAALCRSSGRIALSNGVATAPVALLRTAARLAGFKPRHRTAQFLLAIDDPAEPAGTSASHSGGRIRLRSLAGDSARRRPAAQSDWAQLACLRNNWGVGSDACVIAFDGRVPRLDLTAFGSAVLSGAWTHSSTLGGAALPPVDHWKCSCWFTDHDADFVELEGVVAGRATVLRQALLSRHDHFLFLNDVLKPTDPASGEMTHTVRLPFAVAASTTQDAMTREWRARLGELRVRVFPLGLAQETVRGDAGRLELDAKELRLTGTSAGPGVCCPLFLDWSPERRSARAQWQSLTVAENGTAVAPWQARGWRLRVGDHQWAMYHSLQPGQTARSVLGLHTFHETVIGEFTAAGEVEPIVMVEVDAASAGGRS